MEDKRLGILYWFLVIVCILAFLEVTIYLIVRNRVNEEIKESKNVIVLLQKENQDLKEQLRWSCGGSWFDFETGKGYSGSRWNQKDIPANPITGKSCW